MTATTRIAPALLAAQTFAKFSANTPRATPCASDPQIPAQSIALRATPCASLSKNLIFIQKNPPSAIPCKKFSARQTRKPLRLRPAWIRASPHRNRL